MRVVQRTIGELLYIRRQFQYIRHANEINGYLGVPAKENRVNIYDYKPKLMGYNTPQDSSYNLGDYLGGVIVRYLLNEKGIDLDQWIPNKCHLFAVGSNIIGSGIRGNYQDATIWGSGCIHKPTRQERFFQKISKRKLDIRAVRGPLTREVMIQLGHDCPEKFGDPAILMPLIFQPSYEKKRHHLIIPQFYSECKFRDEHPGEFMISMNTNDFESVINEIAASEIVYTSSLHGIILAESYGVPAVFFRGLAKDIDFKYKDYYYSTGRKDVILSDTYENALKVSPPQLPDLSKLQKGLLDTFPYDLWKPNK